MARYLPKNSDHAECVTDKTCKNENKSKSPAVKNDRRLQNWDDLMRTRQTLHGVLGENLDRRPGELLMNAAEEHRGVREEKSILEYTQIPAPDKFRGCPGFWNLPEELTDKSKKRRRTYTALQLSNEQKCAVPLVERVGVPNRVLEEKDVLPRSRNVYSIWRSMSYKSLKTVQLEDRLKSIEPHKPIMDDLIIIGNAIKQQVPETAKPEATIEIKQEVKPEETCSPIKTPADQPSVIIGGIRISEEATIEHTYLHLAFDDYDVVTNKLITKYIEVYNNGWKTLRLNWKKAGLRKLFDDIVTRPKVNSPFFFDKSELRIIPGQKILLPFWFKINKPGTYSETWEIIILPRLLPETTHFLLKLTGVAYVANLNDRCQQLQVSLNEKIRENLIKEALSDVVDRAAGGLQEPVVYFYDTAKIFESMNTHDKFDNRPLYVYDEYVVNQLGKIYKEVRQKNDPETWNYSIEQLRYLVLRYDKNRVRKISTSLGKTADYPVKYKPMRVDFEALVKLLKTPEPCSSLARNRYSTVYTILCNYFSKISEETEELEDILELDFHRMYPRVNANIKHDISPHEFYDDLSVNKIRVDMTPVPNQRPAPDFLKEIPEHDYMAKYEAYHGIKTGAKGTKGKKEKGKKDKGTKKKATTEKGTKDKKGATKATTKSDKKTTPAKSKYDNIFDPFVEVALKESSHSSIAMSVASSGSSIGSRVPRTILEQYSANMYVIFYRNLCEAVDVIAEALEGYKDRSLPAGDIRRLEECKYWRERKNKFDNLKELIAELVVDDTDKQDVESFNLSPKISVRSELNVRTSRTDIRRHKPVSYPERLLKHIPSSTSTIIIASPRNMSTSTLEHGVLDPNWEDFKAKGLQTEEEDETDLVAKIEQVCEETSVEELFINRAVSCQKEEEEYVSDEEYFYKTVEDESNAK